MIDLEKVANRLTERVFATPDMDQVQKAKLEYGLSLVLGVIIEFSLALLISVLIGTVFNTFVLMISALSLRIFTGGAHCTSYDRCLLFTLVMFLPSSILVRLMHRSLSWEVLVFITVVLFLGVSAYLLFRHMKLAVGLILLIVAGALVWSVSGGWGHGLMLAIVWGMTLQAVMLTPPGKWVVKKADMGMEKIGI